MPVSSWNRTADALVGASILLAGLTGPWAAHVVRELNFFGETHHDPKAFDYLIGAHAHVATAVLVAVLAPFVVFALDRTRWLLVIAAATCALLAIAAVNQHRRAVALGQIGWGDPDRSLLFLLFFPTMWPLLILAAASLLVVLLRIPLRLRPVGTRR